jgi:oligopeptidase A
MIALPKFSQLNPKTVAKELDELLQIHRQQLDKLLKQKQFTWQNLFVPMQAMSNELSKSWGPIGHINSVLNTADWREAYNQCLPILTIYFTELGQNKALYAAIQSIKDGEKFDQLDAVQQKIITDDLRDFLLAGVTLEGEKKQRYAEIQQRMSELTTKFEENVLDATQAWHFHGEDDTSLKGLPEHTVALAKATAQEKDLKGYVLSLDVPCYLSVMKYADDSQLREKFYEAFVTRASDKGPNAGEFDNSNVMVDILKLREESSQLLGFENYAQYSLATKMAESSNQVVIFLEDLLAKSKAFAEKEFIELKKFAQEDLNLSDLHAWDLAYVSEKLQHAKYSINQEMLRPYFPEDKVFEGMFEVIKRIYGMQVEEVKSFDSWHEQVRLFKISDEEDSVRGYFYADLYARAQKRGGAWMDDLQGRFIAENEQVQTPVAFLTCNFNKPVAGQPALLTHDDVVTLFHEFGHTLHHLMTQVDYLSLSGINGVAWDAVELPSQFMENFCWQKEAIPLFSKHHQSGEAIPEDLFNSLLAAKNFQTAMQMVRQIEFSLFDMLLHSQPAPENASQVHDLLTKVREKTSVISVPEFNRFELSFSHIFAGGYGAGYYSYKWAEVLSADAFAQFEEQGVFDRKTGDAFLQAILEKGGSKGPMELFVDFRGREPSNEALLRHSGLN